MSFFKQHILVVITFIVITVILFVVQNKVHLPILLLERFLPGWGWVEIILLGFYGALVIEKLKNPKLSSKWRTYTWLVFSIAFFLQLILGLLGIEECLMTGKLHLPIPGLILCGSVYRFELSFMPILFLSTIVLSGPAWCSHLCYFGAWDNFAASGKKIHGKTLKYIALIKHTLLIVFIVLAVTLRIFTNTVTSTIIAATLGIVGVFIIIIFSTRKGKMLHCISYCPIGTITQYLKFLSPFRIKINSSCTLCQMCIPKCRYDALSLKDLAKGKPGFSCTYCGDCLSACKQEFIHYRFFRFSSTTARNLFLVITVVLHTVFLGLARI